MEGLVTPLDLVMKTIVALKDHIYPYSLKTHIWTIVVIKLYLPISLSNTTTVIR